MTRWTICTQHDHYLHENDAGHMHFLQHQPDSTVAEVSLKQMLNNLKASSFTDKELERKNLKRLRKKAKTKNNIGEWVFSPANDWKLDTIEDSVDSIVWPEAN